MNQEIKYSGFSAVPSDYECSDGSLAVSINLLPEDGALKPILAPSEVMQLQDGEVVKFIHKTSSFTHYIVYSEKSGKIASIDKDTTERIEVGSLYSVSHFNAVGNTLLVFTSGSFYYYLWKSGKYVKLGDHIPDVEVSFGLVGHPRLFSLSDDSKSTFTIYFDGIHAVKATGTTTKVDANGFVIADTNSGNNSGSTGGSTSGSTTPGTTTPNKPSSDTKTETTTET